MIFKTIIQVPGSDEPILSISIILMQSQSSGKISLAGPKLDDDPMIDLNCLSHPYDSRVLIEALKATIHFVENSTLVPGKHNVWPSSAADEDLLVCTLTLSYAVITNTCVEIR